MGGEFPFPFPQDFCGNSHTGPHIDSHMDLHMDSHMEFHKGKMIPIPIGHGKLGIPMPNLVIVARVTIMLELPGRGLLPTHQLKFIVRVIDLLV